MLRLIIVVEDERTEELAENEFQLSSRNYLCAKEPQFQEKLENAVLGELSVLD